MLEASRKAARLGVAVSTEIASSGDTGMNVIRAQINDKNKARPYAVGDIKAASLPKLCAALLAAGYPPDTEVQCFRPGRSEWDIRAKSVRAAATEAVEGDEGTSGGQGAALAETRTRPPRTGLSCPSQMPTRVFNASDIAWHGLQLRLRASNRVLATVKPDAKYPKLFRVHVGPDHVTDLLNRSRAREATMVLALRMLTHEAEHHKRRVKRSKAGQRRP